MKLDVDVKKEVVASSDTTATTFNGGTGGYENSNKGEEL